MNLLFDKLKSLTALYSPLDVLYQIYYCGDGFTDLSYHGTDAVIIAAEKDGRISGFGRPVVAVGDEKAVLEQVKRLYNKSPNIWFQDWLEGGKVSMAARFLLRNGAAVVPFFTQIIDLTENDLHRGVRKSYTSLINKRLPFIKIYSSGEDRLSGEHPIRALFELHKKVCGRQTRSLKTWDIQYKMITAGKCFLVADIENDKMLSGALFYHNGQSAYYAVAKSLNHDGGHAVVWSGILECQRLGCKMVELGQQTFSGGDEKYIGISRFKSGFGGRTFARLYINSG